MPCPWSWLEALWELAITCCNWRCCFSHLSSQFGYFTLSCNNSLFTLLLALTFVLTLTHMCREDLERPWRVTEMLPCNRGLLSVLSLANPCLPSAFPSPSIIWTGLDTSLAYSGLLLSFQGLWNHTVFSVTYSAISSSFTSQTKGCAHIRAPELHAHEPALLNLLKN